MREERDELNDVDTGREREREKSSTATNLEWRRSHGHGGKGIGRTEGLRARRGEGDKVRNSVYSCSHLWIWYSDDFFYFLVYFYLNGNPDRTRRQLGWVGSVRVAHHFSQIRPNLTRRYLIGLGLEFISSQPNQPVVTFSNNSND